MTQEILSAMSSDEVNSISDSTESLQVAAILKRKYYDIISRGDLPEHNQVFQLTPSLDEASPVLMYIPDGIGHVEWIKYYDTNPADNSNSQEDQYGAYSEHDTNVDLENNSGNNSGTGTDLPGYQYVTMLPIRQFLDMINSFNGTDSDVESFTFSDDSNNFNGNFTFLYKNDRQPQYCCILSNYYVIFDSYDNSQDSTLQGSKTMCFGQVVPTFQLVDTFIPDLDPQQFPLLINEAKALAFYELKQQPHQLAMQEVKRQWSTVQKNKSINNRPRYFDEFPNFGRRSGNYYGTRGINDGDNINSGGVWR